MGWLVVRTQPRREKWACENIVNQGGEPYLPLINEGAQVRRGRLVEKRVVCLFPTYVFVREAGRWRYLLGTYGVSGLVMVGSAPAIMRDLEIKKLRAKEDQEGIVDLPVRPKFVDGTRVRVTGGDFGGLEGIYAGTAAHERHRILLDFLGQKSKVLIGDEFLEAV